MTLLPWSDASASGSKHLTRAKDALTRLCDLEKKARPTACDNKQKTTQDIEAAFAADEGAGVRVADMLAVATSLTPCHRSSSMDKQLCSTMKTDGMPESIREQAREVLVKHKGKEKPSANDDAIGDLAQSILRWTNMTAPSESESGGGARGAGKVD